MIIIRLRSGLGNQMFQYAFFKQMQQWHGACKVRLDCETFHWKAHNGLELDRVFGIDLKKDSVPPAVSLKFADVGYGWRHKVLRQLRGRRHRSYRNWKSVQLDEYRNMDDVYLEGYWNNEEYFSGVKDEIRKLYRFGLPLTGSDRALLAKMERGESVAVHVRRGDYKKFPDSFPMCTPDYYRRAIGILSEQHASLRCFVFSDDPEWCKQELAFLPDVTFIDNPDKATASKDMLMMSRCRHNVIANSTFSWWAAWLNGNPQKTVIYPESAMLTYSSMPEGWIKL